MKLLKISELRDGGYLQEVNRRFFHPLGLALGVTIEADDDGKPIHDVDAELFVYDVRDDPEGMCFGSDELAPKAHLVDQAEKQRRPAREDALGYWVQPIEEEET